MLERLHKREFENEVDLGPSVIAKRLGKPGDDPGRAPEILPDLLWEWVKTTTPPHGEAPVEPYFSGIAEQRRTVAVVWRAFVPAIKLQQDEAGHEELDEPEITDDRHRLWPRISQDEIVEIPLDELQQALSAIGLDPVVRIQGDGGYVESIWRRELRPGDRVVLPTTRGLYDDFGWAPREREPVRDISIARSGNTA